jgi:hypothetical protein
MARIVTGKRNIVSSGWKGKAVKILKMKRQQKEMITKL